MCSWDLMKLGGDMVGILSSLMKLGGGVTRVLMRVEVYDNCGRFGLM